MSPLERNPAPKGDRTAAQRTADRIRILREELASNEIQSVLALTPDQQTRFEEWSLAKMSTLAQHFDVDTTASQKRVSWAMRIASTLGALALCAAIVLFFTHYWGYLNTSAQVAIVILTPVLLLLGTEFVFRRERTPYFTGLLALVGLAAFILNLAALGSIFNITPTERALLQWAAFAILLAYRYGLRLMLAFGLMFLIGYVAAAFTAYRGYQWLDFYQRPEHLLLLGLLVFALPFCLTHAQNTNFPPVYRFVGALTFFISVLSLAEWGAPSYLPWETTNIERFYEIAGFIVSATAIWSGILRNWNGLVNMATLFFIVFLFTRLYHWWWDWMPRYLFFAVIGALGIALVLALRRVRGRMIQLREKRLA